MTNIPYPQNFVRQCQNNKGQKIKTEHKEIQINFSGQCPTEAKLIEDFKILFDSKSRTLKRYIKRFFNLLTYVAPELYPNIDTQIHIFLISP